MFLTGPQIIERVDPRADPAEDLGGPRVHGRNGVAHLLAPDDVAAADLVRRVLGFLPSVAGGELPVAPPAPPRPATPADVVPERDREVYDVATSPRASSTAATCSSSRRAGRATSSRASRAWTGHPVGLIANQPRHLGGCLDADSARRARGSSSCATATACRSSCSSTRPASCPGARQEREGVLRHGAALLRPSRARPSRGSP